VAINAGIGNESALSISEQLQQIYSMMNGEMSRCEKLTKVSGDFCKYLAKLNHDVPCLCVAEIVGDLHSRYSNLSAVHFYTFSFICAERCNLNDQALQRRLLNKMDKLEKRYYFGLLQKQFITSELKNGCFGDQLHSIRAYPDKFMQMICHFVDSCAAAYDESTKESIQDMAYSLISMITPWSFQQGVKSELTTKLLSLTQPPEPDTPADTERHHRIARRRESLQLLRRSIVETRQSDLSNGHAPIQLWFSGVKRMLIDMIEEVVAILGQPRNGIDFAVIAMGSFGRGESSAYSDLEMAIVYKNTSVLPLESVKEYLNIFSTLLWLRIVNLMEDDSSIPEMRCGIKLDKSFSFSPEGSSPLIMELSEMLKEFKEGELILSNQLARTRFIWGKEDVSKELQTRIRDAVKTSAELRSRMVVDTFSELLLQYTIAYDKTAACFNVKSEIQLITLFVQVAGLHFGILEASTFDCLKALVQEKKIHKGFAQALKTSLEWLLALRYEIHIFYGREYDNFTTRQHESSPGEADQKCFVISAAQRRKWFFLSPMITNVVLDLIKQVVEAKDFLTLLSKLPEEVLNHLANYFVFQHEDELVRFREMQQLPMHAGIESSFWQDPAILRANYYFEMAVLCSVDGTQTACNSLIGKFFNQTRSSCSIRGDYQEQYLSARPETYGRRRVIPLSSEVHLKIFPELPGQECLASEIAHRVTGYTTSFSCLRRYANGKPVLISKTVIGLNLQSFLHSYPDALEAHIDHESFSWQFIRTLLLNPEDDKPDNFLVMAYYDEWEQKVRLKLVCVDNDHTLSEPIIKGFVFNELLVKSIILCSSRMERPLHPNVVEFFTSTNLEELVITICDALIAADEEHCGMFDKSEWCQETTDDLNQKIESKVPMFVSEEAAVRLFVKLKTLKSLMENDRHITHELIMGHAGLEPVVGNIYAKTRKTISGTSEQRFSKITDGLYRIVGNTRMTISNSDKMLRSSLGKAPTKDQIEKTYIVHATSDEV
jgi:hypothetical protein